MADHHQTLAQGLEKTRFLEKKFLGFFLGL